MENADSIDVSIMDEPVIDETDISMNVSYNENTDENNNGIQNANPENTSLALLPPHPAVHLCKFKASTSNSVGYETEYCDSLKCVCGHVDPGENERQAALRETEEEAGITVDQLQLYENFKTELHYQVRGKPKTVIYWLSELKNADYEVKLSHEHKDCKWLNLKDALDIARYEDLKQALVKADDYIATSLDS